MLKVMEGKLILVNVDKMGENVSFRRRSNLIYRGFSALAHRLALIRGLIKK
jgi:hypothetical protein